MSEPNDTPAPGTAVGEAGAAEPKTPVLSRHRRIAIGLGGVLVLVVGLVATAPIWAPLLPWAPAPAGTEAPVASGNQPVAPGQPDAPPQTEPRSRQKPQPQKIQQEPQPPGQQQEAAASAALQALDRRVGVLEARPIAPASDIAGIRQLLARLAGSAADLDARVGALEARPAAPAAVDTTDMALVLALLQIRGALEAGRPFAPEYEALAALARTRPEIAAAAAPLAEPATTGVAGRAVLARRLRELSGAIATATAPANGPADAPTNAPADANGGPAPDWVDQALIRLRGLVTIRRIDGAAQRQVDAAELALAGGDLEGALGALDTLAGPSAEAAGPWLRMARERLAVEAALDRIEALLVARLGTAANAPAAAPSAVPAAPGSPR